MDNLHLISNSYKAIAASIVDACKNFCFPRTLPEVTFQRHRCGRSEGQYGKTSRQEHQLHSLVGALPAGCFWLEALVGRIYITVLLFRLLCPVTKAMYIVYITQHCLLLRF
jgi:hypothetical protein